MRLFRLVFICVVPLFGAVACSADSRPATADSQLPARDSRPAEEDFRQCVLAGVTDPTGGMWLKNVEGTDGVPGFYRDMTLSRIEFGEMMLSQGGIIELSIGAPKDTKIFPIRAHFAWGGEDRVVVYWVFKDSFGKLKCVSQHS